MKKAILVFSGVLLASGTAFCQPPAKETHKGLNAVYFELAGSSLFYGINYEHGFRLNSTNCYVLGKVGLSTPYPFLDDYAPVLPIGLGFGIGKKKNFFQAGVTRAFYVGDAMALNKNNFSIALAYARRPRCGFYFHASLVLVVFDEEQPHWDGSFRKLPCPGLGFGYSF